MPLRGKASTGKLACSASDGACVPLPVAGSMRHTVRRPPPFGTVSNRIPCESHLSTPIESAVLHSFWSVFFAALTTCSSYEMGVTPFLEYIASSGSHLTYT